MNSNGPFLDNMSQHVILWTISQYCYGTYGYIICLSVNNAPTKQRENTDAMKGDLVNKKNITVEHQLSEFISDKGGSDNRKFG
jgi:hypothetical protein